jgi:hypothetical protein
VVQSAMACRDYGALRPYLPTAPGLDVEVEGEGGPRQQGVGGQAATAQGQGAEAVGLDRAHAAEVRCLLASGLLCSMGGNSWRMTALFRVRWRTSRNHGTQRL